MKPRLLAALLSLATVFAAAAETETRTWTSKDGTATVEGRLFRDGADEITIVLENGRSQTIRKDFLSAEDLRWLEENAKAPTPGKPGGAAADGAPATAKIPAALEGNLVDERGQPASVVREGVAPKYYLFYYSASWCGPCVAFTPELVRFYRKLKSRGASVEFILVPSDKSRAASLAYMRSARMPWPGIDYDAKGVRGVPPNTYGYIPSMVLTDAEGATLLEVGNSLPRPEFLKRAEQIVTGS